MMGGSWTAGGVQGPPSATAHPFAQADDADQSFVDSMRIQFRTLRNKYQLHVNNQITMSL